MCDSRICICIYLEKLCDLFNLKEATWIWYLKRDWDFDKMGKIKDGIEKILKGVTIRTVGRPPQVVIKAQKADIKKI